MRIYGRWSGNPKGTKEDPIRCIAEVWGANDWHPHQCYNKRHTGPDRAYCGLHAKRLAQGKLVDVPKDEPDGKER